jgi:hypothetical protein
LNCSNRGALSKKISKLGFSYRRKLSNRFKN